MKTAQCLLMSLGLSLLGSSCETRIPADDIGIIPKAFFSGVRKNTGEKRWERVHGWEARRIAQHAKDCYYVPNDLWTDELKSLEERDKLRIYVFASKTHVAVVWFHPKESMLAGEPYHYIEYDAICYSSKTGEVVSIGGGGTPLGDFFKTTITNHTGTTCDILIRE